MHAIPNQCFAALMQGLEDGLSGNSPERKRSKKRAFVCTDDERSQRLLRTGVSGETCCLRDTPALPCGSSDGDGVVIMQIMRARDVKEGSRDDDNDEDRKLGFPW